MQTKTVIVEHAGIATVDLVVLGEDVENLREQAAYARAARGQNDREVLEMDAQIRRLNATYVNRAQSMGLTA